VIEIDPNVTVTHGAGVIGNLFTNVNNIKIQGQGFFNYSSALPLAGLFANTGYAKVCGINFTGVAPFGGYNITSANLLEFNSVRFSDISNLVFSGLLVTLLNVESFGGSGTVSSLGAKVTEFAGPSSSLTFTNVMADLTIVDSDISGVTLNANNNNTNITGNTLVTLTHLGTTSNSVVSSNVVKSGISLGIIDNSTIIGNRIGAVGLTFTSTVADCVVSGNQTMAGVGIVFSSAIGASVTRNSITGNRSGSVISTVPAASAGNNVVSGNLALSGWVGSNWTVVPLGANDLMVDPVGAYPAPAGMNRL
jgi:hypothetical protein